MIKKGSKLSLLLIAAYCLSVLSYAQGNHDKEAFSPINTAVPSLTIAPDARSGSMGDNGTSTMPDVNSQYWNSAKYAFMNSKAGASLSYTPWLRTLVSDVALANFSGFYKLGDDNNQAIGASLRYFSLGLITGGINGVDGTGYMVNPYEMAFDISYNRKLSEHYSMGVTLRYIRSDMGQDPSDPGQVPGDAFVADISGYMEKPVLLGNAEALWGFGFNVSNIGSKISYNGGETNYFLPTVLRLGTGVSYPIDNHNILGFYMDLSKYLVPTLRENAAPEEYNNFNSMSSIEGIFKSFSDASGGFREELQEIMLSLGTEYSYQNQFFLRGGYYYENPNKGNRQYFSTGAGFRLNMFQIDAAYLISMVRNNPLDQTLRFTLSFDMDGMKNLFR